MDFDFLPTWAYCLNIFNVSSTKYKCLKIW